MQVCVDTAHSGAYGAPVKPDIPAAEVGARTRAALAYAGITQPELARRTGLHKDTLRAMTRKSPPPRGADSTDELYAVADACGVPRRFMVEGMEPLATDERAELAAVLNRVDALEASRAADQAETRRKIAALEQSIERLANRGQK